MPRVLLLSELYYPEETSTGYFVTKIAEGLAEHNQVRVITGPASIFLSRKDASILEVRNGVEILRCWGTSFPKDSVLGRLCNMLTRSLVIFWKVLRLAQPAEVVLVVTNPPLLPFVALLTKWLKGNRYVLLIHDVYPDAIVAAGLASKGALLVKLAEYFNRVLYRQAVRIITLGRDMSQLAAQKLDHQPARITCIPHWADVDLVHPLQRKQNPLRQTLGLENRFVVLYSGNIGRTHGIEVLAEAMRTVGRSDIQLVVVGFGAKKPWLERFVAEHGMENVTMLGPRPRSELTHSLNLGDVAVIPFVADMVGVSVPSRLYNQMAAGKPIIAMCDGRSELALVITEERIGWVVVPGDVDGLRRAILEAAANPERCAEMGARAAQAAVQRYSFKQSAEAYGRLFAALAT